MVYESHMRKNPDNPYGLTEGQMKAEAELAWKTAKQQSDFANEDEARRKFVLEYYEQNKHLLKLPLKPNNEIIDLEPVVGHYILGSETGVRAPLGTTLNKDELSQLD